MSNFTIKPQLINIVCLIEFKCIIMDGYILYAINVTEAWPIFSS